MDKQSNFGFLAEHSPLLSDLGATAERLFPFDPASAVLKLRLLGEAITQDIAGRIGVQLQQPTQAELLRAVDSRLGLDQQVRQMFHLLRQRGNTAAHNIDHAIGYREGLESLKVARELAVWFHRTFGSSPNFKPGPFLLPDDPSQRLVELERQAAELFTAVVLQLGGADQICITARAFFQLDGELIGRLFEAQASLALQ